MHVRVRACAAAVIACAFAACASDGSAERTAPRTNESPTMSTPELEITIDATHVGDIGYGRVWNATVRAVGAGALPDQTIKLTTFANAKGDFYHGHFRLPDEQRGVKLTFRKIPKRPAALAGFIAKDGTIWELVEAQ